MSDDLKPIAEMVRDAEKHAEAMAADRVRAIEYYRGEMSDLSGDALAAFKSWLAS